MEYFEETTSTANSLSKPLLNNDPDSDDNGDGKVVGILQYKEHKFTRLLFITFSQVVFFALGAAFLSFPMWLNQIIGEHVQFTRGALIALGGTSYISLGVGGALILAFGRLKLDRKSEFLWLTLLGSLFMISCWISLSWIYFSPENSQHSFALVMYCMMATGFSTSIFFFVWPGHVLPLFKVNKKYLFNCSNNVIFAIGATTSLTLKLFMDDSTWMMMLLIFECCVMVIAFVWVSLMYDTLFIPEQRTNDEDNESSSEPTFTIMWELLTFKRNYSDVQLLNDVCDVTSVQFILMVLVYVSVVTVATSFMANLGPLLSSDAETDGSRRDQTVVLIVSTLGQIVGRSSVPIYTYYMDKSIPLVEPTGSNSLDTKLNEVRQSAVRNRTILPITLFISCLFVITLIIISTIDYFPFIVASAVISAGYGMMWCTVINFPEFLQSYDFTLIYCVFSLFSAFGTLSLTLVISLCGLSNEQTFEALMTVAIVCLVFMTVLLANRLSSEPTGEFAVKNFQARTSFC